jgi:hypothetical protein
MNPITLVLYSNSRPPGSNPASSVSAVKPLKQNETGASELSRYVARHATPMFDAS